MKKLIILLMCTTMILLGCEKEPIKIALVATLTGADSEIGVSIRDGFTLKIDEVNASGGINGRLVELYSYDDHNEAETIKRLNKDLFEEGYDLFIGYELSSKYELLQDLLKEDVVVISPTLSSHKASGSTDNFFRTISTNINQGQRLASHANQSYSKVLILYDESNTAFAEGVIEGFTDRFQGSTTIMAIDDVLSMENQIIEAYNGHEAIALVFNPHDAALVTQLFYKNDMAVQFYSSSWGMVSDGYLSAGKAMEGTIFTSHLGSEKFPNYEPFLNRYTKAYNEPPQFAAIYAYEAAIMYFEAVKIAGSTEPNQVREALLSLDSIDGVISKLNFDNYGDIVRDDHLVQLIDGQLILVE